jgi:DTW domain-containing protein YfiP
MSYLSLKNSLLIHGQDYSQNDQVNELIKNPAYHPVVLYPGPQSLNISHMNLAEKSSLFSAGKTPLIFVIDGTWATARKTMWQSQNLRTLPKICFTPQNLSQFRVRKQPDPNCFSTIEAIHQTIELFGASLGFDIEKRQHDSLIQVFNKMVERQLEFIRLSQADPSRSHYRYRRFKTA